MVKLLSLTQEHLYSSTEKQLLLKTKRGTWFIPLNLMSGGIIKWLSRNNLIGCHYLSLSALGKEMYFIHRMKLEKHLETISCGLIRIVSRIKHLLFFSFSKKYRPFEHKKCHECLWCEYFDECKSDFDYIKD